MSSPPTERVIFDVRPTVIKPLALFIMFVIVVVLWLVWPNPMSAAYCFRPFALVVMVILIYSVVNVASTRYVLTTRQVYASHLISGRHVPLANIQSVTWNKGALGWGDVIIASAGGPLVGNIVMAGVDAPDACARQIISSI